MRKQIIILLLGLLIGSCSTGNDFFVVPVKTFGEFPVNGMLAVRDTLAVPGLGVSDLLFRIRCLSSGNQDRTLSCRL